MCCSTRPFRTNDDAVLAGARIAEAERQIDQDGDERYWETFHLTEDYLNSQVDWRVGYFIVGNIGAFQGCNAAQRRPSIHRYASSFNHSHLPDCGYALSPNDRASAQSFFSQRGSDFLFGLTDENGLVHVYRRGDDLNGGGRVIGRVCR
jgi:hypothetical protein